MAQLDETLVAKSRTGDPEAFEELVRRTARLVFTRAYLETGDRQRSEDLTQEAYLRAWRSIRQIRDDTIFRPWLMSILHGVIIDAARHDTRTKRSGARTSDVDQLNRVPDDRAGPHEAAESAEERNRALSVLRSLPEEYRQVLMLRYLAGADYEEIGRQLAISNGSLRGLLSRGLAMLRSRMQTSETRS